MIRLSRIAATSALFVLIATSSRSSFAGDATVPHRERAAGQLTLHIDPTDDAPGRQEWVAEGRGMQLGAYTQVGGHDFLPDGTLTGEFETTAANGSTISGIYYGTFQPIGDGIFRFDVTAEWLTGTGRLEGVTGIGEVVAFLNGATGVVEYETDGDWTLP